MKNTFEIWVWNRDNYSDKLEVNKHLLEITRIQEQLLKDENPVKRQLVRTHEKQISLLFRAKEEYLSQEFVEKTTLEIMELIENCPDYQMTFKIHNDINQKTN